MVTPQNMVRPALNARGVGHISHSALQLKPGLEFMSTITSPSLAASVAANAKTLRLNDAAPVLVEAAIARGEGQLTADGAFVADTGKYTGRSPSDKYIVRDATTENLVWWDNTKAMAPEQFETLLADFTAQMEGADLFGQQLYAGADIKHQLNVAVLTPSAWHGLFIRNLLIRPARAGLEGFTPDV